MLNPIRNLCDALCNNWDRLQTKVNTETDGWKLIAYSIIPIVGAILLSKKKSTADAQIAVEQNALLKNRLIETNIKTTYILAASVGIQALLVLGILGAALNLSIMFPAQLITLMGISVYTSVEMNKYRPQPQPAN